MSTKQSKSTKSTKSVKKVAEAPAPVAAAAPAPVAAAPKKGAAKKTVAAPAVVAAPAPAPVEAAAPKKVAPKKAGAKKPAAKKTATKGTKSAKATKGTKTTKSAKTVKAAEAPAADGEEVDGNGKTRFFKVVIGDAEAPHGRFSGSKPKQAANKALTSIFKSKEQDGGSITGKVKFSIVECTRGSKHKKYHYVGERVKLTEPMKVTIGKGENAKVIEYKFNNRVMKDKTVTA